MASIDFKNHNRAKNKVSNKNSLLFLQQRCYYQNCGSDGSNKQCQLWVGDVDRRRWKEFASLQQHCLGYSEAREWWQVQGKNWSVGGMKVTISSIDYKKW